MSAWRIDIEMNEVQAKKMYDNQQTEVNECDTIDNER